MNVQDVPLQIFAFLGRQPVDVYTFMVLTFQIVPFQTFVEPSVKIDTEPTPDAA